MILSQPAASSSGDETATSATARPIGGRGTGTVVPPRAPSEQHSGVRRESSIGQSLHLSVERPAPGVAVVRMSGEIDLASVPRLTELIRQRLTAAVLQALVLDLSEVTFLGSCGMELLVHAQRRAEHRGIDMFVITGSRAVDRMLELTGMTDRFVRRTCVAEAVAEAAR